MHHLLTDDISTLSIPECLDVTCDDEDTLTVPVTNDEDTLTVPVTNDEDTLTVPVTNGGATTGDDEYSTGTIKIQEERERVRVFDSCNMQWQNNETA